MSDQQRTCDCGGGPFHAKHCATYEPGLLDTISRLQGENERLDQLRRELETANSEIAEEAQLAAELMSLDHQETRGAVAAWKQKYAALREQVTQIEQLVEKWRAKGVATDTFHATMGVGWKTCAQELEDALALITDGPETEKEKDDHARMDTIGDGNTSRTASTREPE